MPEVKISELPAIVTIASDDVLPVVDVSDQATKKITVKQIQEANVAASPTFAGLTLPSTGAISFGATASITGGTARLRFYTIVAGSAVEGLRLETGTLYVFGDATVGVAATIGLTNASNLAANSTGVGTIKFKGATSRDSTGFIKIYIGTTAYYIPVFSAITG